MLHDALVNILWKGTYMRKLLFIILISLITLTGCAKNKESDTSVAVPDKEPSTQMEVTTEKTSEEKTTEEIPVEKIKSILLSCDYYMPYVQSNGFEQYVFTSSGKVEVYSYVTNNDVLIKNDHVDKFEYYVDEKNETVTIRVDDYDRKYEYIEDLKGFVSDYVGSDAEWDVPSEYDFALIPFDTMPTEEEIRKEYNKSYYGFYKNDVTDDTTIEPITETAASPSTDIHTNILSEQQVLNAIERYCRMQNPDLNNMSQDEYNYYWEITESSDSSYCVLFRSYTGAQRYFYIDCETGEVNVSEFVPGVSIEETPTDEKFNIYDYME